MSHDDSRELAADTQPHIISIRDVVQTLGQYAAAILLSVTAVGVTYVLIAAYVYLRSPARVVTTLPFRLDFRGAAVGQYPNGLRFSSADVVNAHILNEVFHRNRLGDLIDFQSFCGSVVVFEANRALNRLNAEYEARLADPKLTPVDRERIERDFDAKRESLAKSDYALAFIDGSGGKSVPPSVIEKTLRDILAVWARQAVVEHKVLDHMVPVLSPNVLETSLFESTEQVVALAILRNRVVSILNNIDLIAKTPGIDLVRTKKTQASLAEVRLELEDVLSFRIDPLITAARSSGMVRNPQAALRALESQLAYSRRQLEAARGREQALRSAFAMYEQKNESAPAGDSRTAPSTPPEPETRNETVMPQLSDSFLDRIVLLAARSSDRDYRQRMVDSIKDAALMTVPAEQSVAFNEKLVQDFKANPPAPGPAEQAGALREDWNRTLAALRGSVVQVNELYIAASRLTNPETELLTITGPPMSRIDRTVSARRLGLYGMVVVLLSIPLVLFIVLLHKRFRRESALNAD